MKALRRIYCLAVGHRMASVRIDTRRRRIEGNRCSRCGLLEQGSVSVMPRNRSIRRRWARAVAKELAR